MDAILVEELKIIVRVRPISFHRKELLSKELFYMEIFSMENKRLGGGSFFKRNECTPTHTYICIYVRRDKSG